MSKQQHILMYIPIIKSNSIRIRNADIDPVFWWEVAQDVISMIEKGLKCVKAIKEQKTTRDFTTHYLFPTASSLVLPSNPSPNNDPGNNSSGEIPDDNAKISKEFDPEFAYLHGEPVKYLKFTNEEGKVEEIIYCRDCDEPKYSPPCKCRFYHRT